MTYRHDVQLTCQFQQNSDIIIQNIFILYIIIFQNIFKIVLFVYFYNDKIALRIETLESYTGPSVLNYVATLIGCYYWFHFLPRQSSFTQPAIVDPASAGRWVCLQILNTTQGTFPLSFLGQVIPLHHVTAGTVGARSHITLSTPYLPSTPLSRPAQVHHSFRFGDGMNKKKSDIFDPPLIAAYL
jgi:hypothetical protein